MAQRQEASHAGQIPGMKAWMSQELQCQPQGSGNSTGCRDSYLGTDNKTGLLTWALIIWARREGPGGAKCQL